MLTADLIAAVQEYAKRLEKKVTFVLAPEGQGHPDRAELIQFLEDLSGASDQLEVVEAEHELLKTPLSFTLQSGAVDTGIVFSGIPGGHEFSSLVLAILHSGGGAEVKLDDSVKGILKNASEPLHFQTYVSLSCHNCPDVVQTLNQFALQNSHISSEMIEGGAFEELVQQNNIQGVPAVFLNGKPFANGKIDSGALLSKLLEKFPELTQTQSAPSLPTQDVVVIGAGPAGVAAAIYAARKGVKVTVVADRVGGQVKDTMDIENFVSVQLTNGPKLSSNLYEHLMSHDVTLKEGVEVNTLALAEQQGQLHEVTLNTGELIQSKTLIVATGAKWRQLGVPGEKENVGSGVAYCPHCDGPFFKGKPVAVIGGGNSGVEAALDLAGIVDHVTVVEFMPELKADQILVKKLHERPNIDVVTSAETKEVVASNGKVTGLTYANRDSGEQQTLNVDAVFVQIGLVPNAQFLPEQIEKTKYGEVVVNERCQTSVPGVFACGDVTTVPYKQILIAMGEGSKAALAAFDYLIKF